MMTERAEKDMWVEIHRVLLEKGERAPQVPQDTREVPLEMKVKGFLLHEGALGDEVEIVTAAGREIQGTLSAVNPSYDHLFGPPIPELSTIGREVREILRKRGGAS
jgi:hypothetical protein